jgi:large subunit ribosomal protein L5
MSLLEKYRKEVVPEMKKIFGYKNYLQTPKIKKVVINIGIGKNVKEPNIIEIAENTLTRISGQKPIKTKAKQSISSFKTRKGMIIGLAVTIRGKRMYDFLEKLIDITLPRVRDFRGLSPKSLDGKGNLSIGFKEYIAFPEIKLEEIERSYGLEVSIATTAKNNREGLELFKLLGFPFKNAD